MNISNKSLILYLLSLIHNHEVPSSSLGPATKYKSGTCIFAGAFFVAKYCRSSKKGAPLYRIGAALCRIGITLSLAKNLYKYGNNFHEIRPS